MSNLRRLIIFFDKLDEFECLSCNATNNLYLSRKKCEENCPRGTFKCIKIQFKNQLKKMKLKGYARIAVKNVRLAKKIKQIV